MVKKVTILHVTHYSSIYFLLFDSTWWLRTFINKRWATTEVVVVVKDSVKRGLWEINLECRKQVLSTEILRVHRRWKTSKVSLLAEVQEVLQYQFLFFTMRALKHNSKVKPWQKAVDGRKKERKTESFPVFQCFLSNNFALLELILKIANWNWSVAILFKNHRLKNGKI